MRRKVVEKKTLKKTSKFVHEMPWNIEIPLHSGLAKNSKLNRKTQWVLSFCGFSCDFVNVEIFLLFFICFYINSLSINIGVHLFFSKCVLPRKSSRTLGLGDCKICCTNKQIRSYLLISLYPAIKLKVYHDQTDIL